MGQTSMGEEPTNPIELSGDGTSSVNMAADDEGISSISTQGKISKWFETTEPEVINKGKPQIITKDKFEIIDLCSLDEDDNEKQEKGVKKATNTFIRRSANSEAHKKKDTMGQRRLRIPKHGAGTYPVRIGAMRQSPDVIEVFAAVCMSWNGKVSCWTFYDADSNLPAKLLEDGFIGPPVSGDLKDPEDWYDLGKLFDWDRAYRGKEPEERLNLVWQHMSELYGLSKMPDRLY